LILSSPGCGPGSATTGNEASSSASDSGDSGGESASSASSSSDSSSASDTSGGDGDGTGSTGSTSSTGDGDGTCDGFDDDYGPAIPVSIRNGTGMAIHLQADPCNMTVPLAIQDAMGQGVGGLSECWTCAGAIAGGCVCPGPPCFISPGVYLEADAVYETSIGATRWTGRDLPVECASDLCGTPCQQPSPLEAGTYDVVVTWAPNVTCTSGSCTCTPDPVTGHCFVDGDGELVFPVTASGSFMRPDDQPVQIVIQ
jgi:hypothetical protein